MTNSEWHNQWIATLMEHRINRLNAEEAFFALYGNQYVDVTIDPVQDAMQLLVIPKVVTLPTAET